MRSPPSDDSDPPEDTGIDDDDRGKEVDPPETPPSRFFASIPVEPDRAGFVVARIMDALLVELTRSPGATVHVTLDLEGNAGKGGYPKDVVEIVKANARDLKIGGDSCGFNR